VTATTFVDWAAARAAVAQAGPRLTAMLRTAHRAVDTISAMTKRGGNVLDELTDLSRLSGMMVEGEGRRPLGQLADRIDASVGEFLATTEAADPDGTHSWLFRGTELPLSTLTCHMLNELTVHGRDLATAVGVPWPIDRSHAALIVLGFVFPALHTLGPAVVVQEKAATVRARFEVRLRGDGRAWLRFSDGDFSVEGSPQGPVDCHLAVDPEAFLLVAWGRINQWQAIPKGQLLAWGRRPWLGLQMRSWLRNP
jgi:hypothetical protein